MGKIISISIFKGGTGKTATAVSLGTALAQEGHNVLLVDLDQQASATRHLGLDPEQVNPNMFHVFHRQVPPRLAIKDLDHGFALLAGNSLLAAVEASMEEGDEGLLRELLAGIVPEYDYIVLDTPPGKAMLSLNALAAADEVIIPLQSERPALDGVQDLLRFIQDIIWEKYNPNLKIRGILPTMFKRSTTHSAGIVAKAREIWGDKVFPFEVPEAIIFPRAFDRGVPLPLYDPAHDASHAYRRLARSLNENNIKINYETDQDQPVQQETA